jgi:hypothetical protein
MGAAASCCTSSKQVRMYNSGLIARLFPQINNVDSFTEYIRYAIDHDHPSAIKRKLILESFIQEQGESLNLSEIQFNPFVSFAAGTHANTVDQQFISNKQEWMLCHFNTPNDGHWANRKFPLGLMADPDAFGPGHVCITTKSLYWKLFNITTIATYAPGLPLLRKLKQVAEAYTMKRGWPRAGYFFHC